MTEGHFMLLLFLRQARPFPDCRKTHVAEVQFPKRALVLRLERWSLAGSGEKQRLYAVSMGSIYSCLWMQLHSNSLKKRHEQDIWCISLFELALKKLLPCSFFLAWFPEEIWLGRSWSVVGTHASPLVLYLVLSLVLTKFERNSEDN